MTQALWDEIGSSGDYRVTFTPAADGLYRIEVLIDFNKEIVGGEYRASEARVQVDELHKLHGLDAANPMTVSQTERKVPADGSEIDLDISEAAGAVTVQRV